MNRFPYVNGAAAISARENFRRRAENFRSRIYSAEMAIYTAESDLAIKETTKLALKIAIAIGFIVRMRNLFSVLLKIGCRERDSSQNIPWKVKKYRDILDNFFFKLIRFNNFIITEEKYSSTSKNSRIYLIRFTLIRLITRVYSFQDLRYQRS